MVAVYLWLTRLFFLTITVAVSLVMSNSDFCASVFETQIGKLTPIINEKLPSYLTFPRVHFLKISLSSLKCRFQVKYY